jgi:hypothetical protein
MVMLQPLLQPLPFILNTAFPLDNGAESFGTKLCPTRSVL